MLSSTLRLGSTYGSILSRWVVMNIILITNRSCYHQGWTNYFLMVFPSLLFLSTYSIVILFWAQVVLMNLPLLLMSLQVYYAAILVSYPLLRPVCLFFNIAVYNSQPIYDSPIAPQVRHISDHIGSDLPPQGLASI